MPFKHNWEKANTHLKIDDATIRAMVQEAIPRKRISSYEVISGGLVNLNIKLIIEDQDEPLILRIYLRDQNAAYREKKIADLIGHVVPVPKVYHVGDFDEYRYALTQFMPGTSLRDFLLNNINTDIYDVMYDTGKMLAIISSFRFNHSGFFDKNLVVSSPTYSQDLIVFLKECLEQPNIIEQLGQEKIIKIDQLFQKYKHLLPSESENHLVHGDYDPANILVDKINGHWKITAILDWEFAFSGSWLWDVSNMLRYAHQMPTTFEKAFLSGITDSGLILPNKWKITTYLLNISSLLDLLTRCIPKETPKQCSDILELIDHSINELYKTLIRKQ